MAKPKPTGGQLALMLLGGGVGAGVALLTIGGIGAVGGAIIGVGVAIGGLPYFRAVGEAKKRGEW